MDIKSLPIPIIESRIPTEETIASGIITFFNFMTVIKCDEAVNKALKIVGKNSQGWEPVALITAIVVLNAYGLDAIDDVNQLEKDPAIRRAFIKKFEKNQKKIQQQFRKGKTRAVPSASATRRFLETFHNEDAEKNRPTIGAYIPERNESLNGLLQLIKWVVALKQSKRPEHAATLDMDATIRASNKENALFCYKHFKGYQPLNTYWAEQDIIIHSEFRDGNVPAGYEQLRVLKEALEQLPDGVEKVYLRSDTAGYQHNLMRYCAEGHSERFGVIEFGIGVDVTSEFKAAVNLVAEEEWHVLIAKNGEKTNQEWAEVCFVPTKSLSCKETYRYIAIREKMAQMELPQLEMDQLVFPFPTMKNQNGDRYKLFGMVTNRTIDGNELILWTRERCGKSEECHHIMKGELSASKMPSGKFGANAAWWLLMILSLDLLMIFKEFCLGREFTKIRMKALRAKVLFVAGKVIFHARQIVLRISKEHPSAKIILYAQQQMLAVFS